MSDQDAQVWRVCNHLRLLIAPRYRLGQKSTYLLTLCQGCPRIKFQQGRPVQQTCYRVALQVMNTVTTGDPQKRAEDEN